MVRFYKQMKVYICMFWFYIRIKVYFCFCFTHRLKYMQESLGDIKADMSNRLEMAKKVTDRIAILQKEVQSAEGKV